MAERPAVSEPGSSHPSPSLYMGHPALPGHDELASQPTEKNDPKMRSSHLPGYELVPDLSDEFDGDVLDPKKWSTQRSVVKWAGRTSNLHPCTRAQGDFALPFRPSIASALAPLSSSALDSPSFWPPTPPPLSVNCNANPARRTATRSL